MTQTPMLTKTADVPSKKVPLAPHALFVRRFHNFALFATFIVLAIGILGLTLWIFDIRVLSENVPAGIKPKTNTSIAFILSALALSLLNKQPLTPLRKTLATCCSLLVLAIGALTLVQHLTGLNFHIDQLLFTEDPGARATVSPNRMGPPASIAFTFAGVSLLLLSLNSPRLCGFSQLLAFLIAGIGTIPLLGYAYNVPMLYLLSYTGIAAPTALALILVAVSILFIRPDLAVMNVVTSNGPGGIMARRLIIPAILLPLLLEWLRMLAIRNNLIETDLSRIVLILSVVFFLTILIWRNAIELARLGRAHERALHELRSASAAKDQFLAVLSHELRTPLTPAAALVEVLKDDPALPADTRSSLYVVKRNIDLEVKLIDDLLDLTRVQNSRINLQFEPVDLHEVISHVLQICHDDIQRKKLHINLQLTAANSIVEADTARIQQVFWNLLKNAVKFTGESGHITFHSRNEGAFIVLTVSDTGVGIDPAALPRIFNAFEQANSSIARQFGGLGLGLAISKSLLILHKGAISVASPGPGQGTVFTVTLPLSSRPVLFKPIAPAAAAALPQKSLRILLVEDNADTASALARLLKLSNCSVAHVPSIGAALQAAQNESFDLLISDLGLPDGTGHELMVRIQTLQKIPGIAISGYGMDGDIQRSIQAGFSRHLTKPLNLADLRSAIDVFRS